MVLISSIHISVVSPVYLAENCIDELLRRLKESLHLITENYEIILVEDAGMDHSWAKIEEHGAKDSRIKGVQLSRNFGQHAAIAAGMHMAKGEWLVVMDCDLQDQPEEIAALYAKAQEGYDLVLAKRVERCDSFLQRAFSYMFYRVLSALSGVPYDNTIANFGIYHRNVLEPMLQIQSSLQYFPSMVNWVGFRKISIDVEHAQRYEGKSSYSFGKKLSLAFNIMLDHSDKPLKLVVKLGALISSVAFIFALLIAYQALRHKIPVLGYSSLIISIAFFSGFILSVLGILGLYIGKIFHGIKAKPAYLIRTRINHD